MSYWNDDINISAGNILFLTSLWLLTSQYTDDGFGFWDGFLDLTIGICFYGTTFL